MTARGRLTGSLPLAIWAGGGALATGLLVVVVVGSGLAYLGRLDGRSVVLLAGGVAVALGCAVVAGLAGSYAARQLRSMEHDALMRLSESAPGGPVPDAPFRELRELSGTLHAMYRRVRVADEIAERHRRTAQAASAGMFELLSGLVAAEEGARGQLAAELHDTVAQTLMMARSMLAMDLREPDEVRRAAELVSEAEEQVRGVMARTRPPALRDGDLALAVATLCDDMNQRYALDVHLDWPAQPRPLPLATAVTAYRFFQEALLNVVKHADEFEAEASLDFSDRELVAAVRDRGPGFDPDTVAPEQGRHVGLGLLHERARLAGGSIEVTSWPGDGTTLRLRLPMSTSIPLLPFRAA